MCRVLSTVVSWVYLEHTEMVKADGEMMWDQIMMGHFLFFCTVLGAHAVWEIERAIWADVFVQALWEVDSKPELNVHGVY